IDRVEAENLGAGRRVTAEIGMSVLHPNVVRERKPVEVLVSGAARHAEVRDRRARVRVACRARPAGQAERGNLRRDDAALSVEASEAAETLRARLARAEDIDRAFGRAHGAEAADRAAQALRAIAVADARGASGAHAARRALPRGADVVADVVRDALGVDDA